VRSADDVITTIEEPMTTDPADVLRPLRRTRQVREFEPTRLAPETLDAIADVARWTGSSKNTQPWRFIVITDPSTIRAIHAAGLPQTRGVATAPAAIAIVLPAEPDRAVHDAYDDGRVAERILVAAAMLDIGAGISWIRSDVRPAIAALLDLPSDRMVRTVVQLGIPTAAARLPKSEPGKARLPREEVVFQDRWPAD
jgi:nitroreductase